MTGEQVVRRLAAIVAADVVGYSRLIGADEDGTLAQLAALRREIVDHDIARHAGRLFKETGDGFLVEFASAVQAVTWAMEIQKQVKARAGEGQSLRLRIGIHVGDVVVQGDDLMGDGVNIAARIEGIADPGGLAISRAVYEQIRDRLTVSFEDRGEIELKNISRPVHIFAIGGEKAALTPALTLPDKPSIAVLPFQNMSGDPEQEYFADGMVEEIITGLSRNRQLFIIARNSSFAYKGKSPDVRQVGRDLGVRYVLEGSVRKSGGRVRLTGQLIDAATGVHIWADRFDGELSDVFELQDQMTSNVIGGILPLLDRAEIERAKRKTGHLEAYDYFLRSRAALFRATPEATTEALVLARHVISLDPDYALGHALIAHCLNWRRSFGWSVDRACENEEAERAIRHAIELDRNDPRVLAWCGQTMVMNLGQLHEGAELLDQAVRLDPNFCRGLINRGSARIALGEPDKAIGDVERALRLSPLDPAKPYALTIIGRAHTLCGRLDLALPFITEALRLRPNAMGALVDSIVAHALAGDLEGARRSRLEYQQVVPEATIELFRRRWNNLSASGKELYVRGLRLAGLPE